MASWRTVHGRIHKLDRWLVSDADVQAFFEEERILGRGSGDGEGGFDFEVAIAGRRRRVATLDDSGTVFRGRSVHDLVELMRDRLRKVEVELDGEVAHGPIDLGSVDISNDFLLEEADEGASDGEQAEAAGQEAGADHDDELDEALEREGPMMVVVDLPLSEVPSLVASDGEPVAVSKLGDALVITAERSLPGVRKLFPRPSYQIVLCAERGRENPALYVRRDNQKLTWNWEGELPIFPWIEPGSEGHEFVVDETGAGAVARKAVADVIDARFADIRSALQVSAPNGVRALVQALNLPEEIADVLEGVKDLDAIPNSRLFRPGSAGSAFEDRIAYEIAGEGFVEPEVMGAYRKIYLERPWAVAIASAVQTAIAGGMLANGFTRAGRGQKWKMRTALGGWLFVGGLTRIATTSYAQSVVAQRENDIATWKMMRNLQEDHG
ncbi:hypothetical protein J2S70_000793 [Trueperella bonasi]|uniref:Uncharacterized protein n=1 Tax=Trueperella bonasi TaxID=312286 RepID=A0ABT9NFP8_9ACTO|nr:hypothetical protein [Trueperella bonasi]MDP9806211.1 hypothetical protein [Trueperella bonasi]